MITIQDLAMSFGDRILFANSSFNLNKGEVYGLVGANGAGKSTFLKGLMRVEEIAFGEIAIQKNASVGWLRQNQYLYEEENIIDVVIAGNTRLWNAMKEKEKLLSSEKFTEKDGYRVAELEEIILDNDGYNVDAFAGELLEGLGISKELFYKPLKVLSGGYKLRVLLAQALFDNPDILLLDEPTNHLDIVTIYWLENYLKNRFKGLIVVISHDKSFLNNIVTHILDIDYGEITKYTGNYDDFIVEKAQVMEQKLKEKKHLEAKIAAMQRFIERFGAKATKAKQAASRMKMIDKIELPDIKNSSRVSPSFSFTQTSLPSKLVLKVNNLAKSYKDKELFNKVSFNLERGEKLLIIGANGKGKSTLLKILLNLINQDEGSYNWGDRVGVSYFAQESYELLEESNAVTIIDWMKEKLELANEQKIRQALARMLFKQEEAYKPLSSLSGGESSRVLFAKIMLEESNTLVMDEPTNHLDVEAKESLQEALKTFPGTLIFVSHDREFASQIATKVLAFSKDKIIEFHGTYDEYLKKYRMDFLSPR